MRFRQTAFCFSQLHASRLGPLKSRDAVIVLRGQYVGPADHVRLLSPRLRAIFAGRLIPEKRAQAIPAAIASARQRIPGLEADIFGDGPELGTVLAEIAAFGLDEKVDAPGVVDADRLDHALSDALCLILPSRREGYGLVVVEALARGTPAVVVAGPDNAAIELISEGENGFIAPSDSAVDLAAAVERIYLGGEDLRISTAAWFDRHAAELALESSLGAVLASYADNGAISSAR